MKREELRALSGLTASIGIALLFCTSAAHAVDGVIEINHASIIAAGGYPAVISSPGSYVLTGNLTPTPGANGVDVFANEVTLDLNGFQIRGVGVATGINGSFTGLTVQNGQVSGFTTGINAGVSGKVLGLHVTNCSTGIQLPGGGLLLDSTIAGNGNGVSGNRSKIQSNVIEGNGVGINGAANVIVQNSILSNGGGGILTFSGGLIQQNVLEDNGAFGISDGLFGPALIPPPPGPPRRTEITGNTIQGTFLGPGIALRFPALIADNVVSTSATDGIFCGAACNVHGNVIETNNLTFAAASGGASVFDGSNVADNSISFNNGFGLTLPITAGYSQNTFFANGPLDVVSFGPHPTSGFNNLCSGVPGPALTCP